MTPPAGPLEEALRRLAAGEDLPEDLSAGAFAQVMRGEATAAHIAGLLMGLRVKGETAPEVAGVVRALRDVMVRVAPPDGARAIDTCGTGGGTTSTFNISTAAAFVAAAAGAVVAKHGNRSYTSRCGSADLLEALGLPVAVDPGAAERLLAAPGLAFLFAPAFHPATKAVTPVRRELAVPTLMNLVGPLANPAGVTRQVLGVWDVSRAPLVAQVAARLGAEHVLVVHARIGMDEIAPEGPTDVWEVRRGTVTQWVVEPADCGVAEADARELVGSDPPANAARVARLLEDSRADPSGRVAVALNAGAALYVAGVSESLREGVALAADVLDAGAGARVLERLRRETSVSTSG